MLVQGWVLINQTDTKDGYLIVSKCYAPSLYLRTDRESKSTTVMQKQEGSLSLAR